jgi:hypothetical protein
MSARKTLLIDADPVVYRCGFAAETHSYHLVVEGVNTGEVVEIRFDPKDDKTAGALMKEWLAEQGDTIEVLDKTLIVTPQPVEFALEAVKTQMESIHEECGTQHSKIYISGGTNYRFALATQRPYKGNRTADKPVHYHAIREYLSKFWGAETVDKIEADDHVSIVARATPACIIATIDKDLDQIPGDHYNYMKQVHYGVSPEEAELFFYQQAISGDATDNIPGCFKVGAVKAQRIVYDAHTEGGDWAVVWQAVLRAYAESVERVGCPYAGTDTSVVALETARLVKLQEYPNQLWTPPGVPDELVTEELYNVAN